jgi:cAMP-dependent protein kinase regulator
MSGFQDSSSDEGEEAVDGDWLNEEDDFEYPEPETKVVEKIEPVKLVKSEWIMQHADLFYALMEVDEWGEFGNMTDQQQEQIMKTLTVRVYQPGENIIVEGETGVEMYFVVATEKTWEEEQIEVVSGNIRAGTEVFLTRLRRGQYFGQKFFLTRRPGTIRGATCRIPKDSPVPVHIAILTAEFFNKWASLRNLLLVRTVPLLQKLPKEERQKILREMRIHRFEDGEHIIRQGDVGEEFFIIQEGSVKVVQSVEKGLESSKHEETYKTLVMLREGHVFGEMALFSDQPRVASVVSVKMTICLVLSKRGFKSALSEGNFKNAMDETLNQRIEIRKTRAAASE